MASPSNLRLTGLDFEELRTNFKNYLATQDEFTDYDATGSAFSVLFFSNKIALYQTSHPSGIG